MPAPVDARSSSYIIRSFASSRLRNTAISSASLASDRDGARARVSSTNDRTASRRPASGRRTIAARKRTARQQTAKAPLAAAPAVRGGAGETEHLLVDEVDRQPRHPGHRRSRHRHVAVEVPGEHRRQREAAAVEVNHLVLQGHARLEGQAPLAHGERDADDRPGDRRHHVRIDLAGVASAHERVARVDLMLVDPPRPVRIRLEVRVARSSSHSPPRPAERSASTLRHGRCGDTARRVRVGTWRPPASARRPHRPPTRRATGSSGTGPSATSPSPPNPQAAPRPPPTDTGSWSSVTGRAGCTTTSAWRPPVCW